MAAPKFNIEQLARNGSSLSVVEQTANITSLPGLEILNRMPIKSVKLADGTEHHFLYTFSDGRTSYEPIHEVRQYQPRTKKVHERAVMSTVPWMTGLSGHHESLNEEAIANRLVSVSVSREKTSAIKALQHIGHTSLAQEAWIQLLVHEDLAGRGLFMQEELTGTGYSLAAIILNGVAAQAKMRGTNLVHGEALDPGPATKLKPEELYLHSLTQGAGRELKELYGVLKMSDKEERKRLLKTFPFSVRHILQNFDLFIALTATGESARLAAAVPHDTSLNITMFKGFKFNQRGLYKQIFTNHPNVRITEEDGCHFSGAHPMWRKLMIGRIALVQRELEAGIPAAEIDHAVIDKKIRSKLAKDKTIKKL